MKAARSSALVLLTIVASGLTAGCANAPRSPENAQSNAQLAPTTAITRDLMNLPPPKGKIPVAVYGFRDQTGQYKPSPESSFSSSVTQGAASLLVKALKDSRWYVPVERENLQNLLTERKIVRAVETNGTPVPQLPALIPAQILMEGGIIAYESNVRTGGIGARYLGIGPSAQYRTDQVTVNLRTVDMRTGQVLTSISSTKTIYSYEAAFGVFTFVKFKRLLELETGMTRNEPVQLCVREAIEAAVAATVVQGLKDRLWAMANEADWSSPVVQHYLQANSEYGLSDDEIEALRRNAGKIAVPPSEAARPPA